MEILVKATDQTAKGFGDTKKGANELKGEISKLEAELRAIGKIRSKAEIDADTKVAETKIAATEARLEELRAKPTSPKIEADIAVAERNLGRLQTQLEGLRGEAAAQINAKADTAAAESRLAGLKAQARELDGMSPEIKPEVDTSDVQSGMSKIGEMVKAPALAAGAVGGATLGVGFANSLDFGAADAKMRASLNLSKEEAAKAGAAASIVFARGYTDNMSEVTDAIGAIGTSMVDLGTISQPELEALARKALKLADVFDVDVTEATRAAGRLMKSGLAADADEAFDLITAGMSQVGDASGDMLDTMNEYSPFLQRLGIDGESAFGSLAAAQKLGIRDTDAWGDAIKEFSLRAIDTADSTTDAYKSLRLDADKTRDAIAKGGPEAEKAMSQVVQALMKVQDPVERNRIGVELFGTQWEDTARDILPALDPLANKMGDVEGATDRMVDQATTAKDKVQGLKNSFDEWTASLVETDGPLGDVATGLMAFGPQALDVVGDLAPMLAALKMSGIADAIKSGPVKAVDEIGDAADRSATKVGKGGKGGLVGALGSIAAFTAAGALAANGVNEMNKAFADDEGLTGWASALDFGTQNLNDLLSGDFDGFANRLEGAWAQVERAMSGKNLFEFDVNLGPAQEQVSGFMDSLRGQVGTVEINGRTDDAVQALADITQKIKQGGGEVTINGQTMDAEKALDLVVKQINASGGMVSVNGNMVPAGDALKMFLGDVQRTVAALVIDGNTDPASGKVTAVLDYANGSTGTVTLEGDPYLANGKVEQIVQFANGSQGTVIIEGNPDPATGKVQATVRYADGSTGRILVDARTGQAEEAINHAARNRTATITVNWAGLDRNIDPRYGGGRITGAATGGIRSGPTLVGERGPELVRAYADGGIFSGRTGWVGENGPELVNLPAGSTVYPTGQSQQMAAAGGGGGAMRIDVHFTGNTDSAMSTAIMHLIRTGQIQIKGVNI
ncbi:phage tail tape measure protein [Pseudonocardia sp. WMMC193]|uniref:phage tail tape measure protein n=1 Tax=Pseudonocardia sp. WMMC193 TaxID=2911965 RepID=UPI001F160EDA|nr:phage tail tape measure protein [Pseudonocardia sp. WMMC193]MCF7548511.1 phage tail tape measure protein [Pseudonocardia sp. WMMC193]